MAITERIEDYLETVFEIELEGDLPSVTELASRLSVRKATVVVAVRKMVELGLLEHRRYGKIDLTPAGRDKALETYRRHQHLTFLFQILGLDDTVAEEMACASEHSLDPKSERRLAAFVDFFCRSRASGHPWIACMNEFIENPERLSIPLTMLLPRQEAKILRITSTVQRRRDSLLNRGFVPEAVVHRLDDGRGREPMVSLNGEKETLSSMDALSIWVLPADEDNS